MSIDNRKVTSGLTLNPEVWGKHYWFVLYTMAVSYPENVNVVSKKKYYDFIQNLPLFLPDARIGSIFSEFLDKYPVTPYLDSRPSFVKWVHFIHNKINVYLGKKEITYAQAMTDYYKQYEPINEKRKKERNHREKYLFFGMIIFLITITGLLLRS